MKEGISKAKIQRKLGRWKVASVILWLLLAIMIVGIITIFDWQGALKRYVSTGGTVDVSSGVYKSDYQTIEELFEAKTDLITRIGEEGCVLLKNENEALPLSKKSKVSLFGHNSTNMVYGLAMGSGQIMGNPDTLNMVLTSVGIDVNQTLWDYYVNYEGSKRRASNTFNIGEISPKEFSSDVTSSYKKYSDAAFVVISRNFGEGLDAPTDPAAIKDGDGTHYILQLQDKERETIEEAKKCSDNVIVIINSDNAMEIKELKDDPEIDAILQVGGMGVYGLYGVANVIAGEVSPSGRLVDIYTSDNFSSPAAQNYGDFTFDNNEEKYVVYQEGVYVGYKYYETRYEDCVLGQGDAASDIGTFVSEGAWNYNDEVCYPFGFGLSYSEFNEEITGIDWNEETKTVDLTVKVTNVGNYDAKDVVEVYVQSPYTQYDKDNNVEKPSVVLVGFEKTDTLEAETGTQDVTVSIDMNNIASYDYTNAKTYILDYGTYYFGVGNGAHDALNNILAAKGYTTADGMDYDGNSKMAISYEKTGEGDVDAVTCMISKYTGEEISNQMESADLNYYGDLVTYLSRKDWSGTWSGPIKLSATDEMVKDLANGSAYEKDESVNDLSKVVEGVNYASTATDVTFADLIGKEYDDPIWEDALNQLTLDEMTRLIGIAISGEIESIGMPEYLQFDGPLGLYATYRTDNPEYAKYATQYASETTTANTFNKALAVEVGEMFGNDGLWTGYQGVWGPGIDTHRTPFGGRNGEYYSEDGIVSYYFGKHMSEGALEYGLISGGKHIGFNDQEVNRSTVCTFVNEQAAREIYMRAFEGSLADGGGLDAMCGKNRIGCIVAAGDEGMIQGLINKEWGFKGTLVSDSSTETNGLGAHCVITGLTQLDTMKKDYITGNGSLSPEKIANDSVLFEAAREACHKNLYTWAHSSLANSVDIGTGDGNSEQEEVVETKVSMPWYERDMWIATVLTALLAVAAFAMAVLWEIRKMKGSNERGK